MSRHLERKNRIKYGCALTAASTVAIGTRRLAALHSSMARSHCSLTKMRACRTVFVSNTARTLRVVPYLVARRPRKRIQVVLVTSRCLSEGYCCVVIENLDVPRRLLHAVEQVGKKRLFAHLLCFSLERKTNEKHLISEGEAVMSEEEM
jgi:hypothetical protein